jgi:ubiquinone/menaquinone biosynthesis C-methylase UbiE
LVDTNAVDLDWEPGPLWRAWPRSRDNHFVLARIQDAFPKKAKAGTSGRVLDVACGAARNAPALHRRGWQVFGLEPSPAMIVKARASALENGAPLELFRGIGETLPFRDASFDRVLCESSLDHFANPSQGMREMARVLRPGGTAIIATVNYGGLSCRGSRLVYAFGRKLRLIRPGKHLFWDTPVPHEHTFEADLPTLKKLARSWLELEDVYGVSLFWGFPGWGRLLGRLPKSAADDVLRGLDRIARRAPTASDFIISRWRRP